MKLEDLLAAETINANNMEVMDGKVSSMKVAVIVLAVLLVLALAAAAFFGLKWHESLDDYDDDDDDDDDDDHDFEEPQPVKRRTVERPQQRKQAQSAPARKPQPAKQEARQSAPVRKPQQSAQQSEKRQLVNADGVPMKRVRMADGTIRTIPADKIRVKSRPAGDEDVKVVKKSRPEAEEARVSAEAARRPQPAKDNWKSKNFLTEDDDLDFSFIDGEE